MKRYMRGFVAVVTSLAFMGGVANAQQACEGATITNTGPGSTNEVKCVDSRDIKVTCVNDVYVVNNISQTGRILQRSRRVMDTQRLPPSIRYDDPVSQ